MGKSRKRVPQSDLEGMIATVRARIASGKPAAEDSMLLEMMEEELAESTGQSSPRASVARSRTGRRTKEEMEALHAALVEIVQSDPPMTVRQVFYQAESKGLVEKTDDGYRRVQESLKQLRISGEIGWDDISDNSRSVLHNWGHASTQDAIRNLAETYTRDFWQNSDERPVIYIEKDALAGVLQPTCDKWQVPLAVARGEASLSFKHEVADSWLQGDSVIYMFTDLDGAGEDMERVLKETFEEHFECYAEIKRVALTPTQVKQHKLPTRPAKGGSGIRAGKRSWAVELDALPKHVLTDLVEQCIRPHVDDDEWEEHERQEQADRKYLQRFVSRRRKP
jgi:hypothetical protein